MSVCLQGLAGPVGRRVSGPVKKCVCVRVCVSECVLTRFGWSCGQEIQLTTALFSQQY